MQKEVQKDFEWQEGFLPEVQRVLTANACHLINIEVANPQADMKRATDFHVFTKVGDIAVRIRRHPCTWRDWTVRYSRPSGAKTEYEKLKEGYGDFYLYAWEGNTPLRFQDWVLIDLHLVRACGALCRGSLDRNKDGSSNFLSIPVRRLGDCIVATNMQISYIVPKDDPEWYDESDPYKEHVGDYIPFPDLNILSHR